jgi:hypothetical protein
MLRWRRGQVPTWQLCPHRSFAGRLPVRMSSPTRPLRWRFEVRRIGASGTSRPRHSRGPFEVDSGAELGKWLAWVGAGSDWYWRTFRLPGTVRIGPWDLSTRMTSIWLTRRAYRRCPTRKLRAPLCARTLGALARREAAGRSGTWSGARSRTPDFQIRTSENERRRRNPSRIQAFTRLQSSSLMVLGLR